MRSHQAARLAVSLALAGSASLAILLPGSPAFARNPPIEVTCTTLSGDLNGGVASISGCSNLADTGGSGTAPVSGIASVPGPGGEYRTSLTTPAQIERLQ
jgi:hypothetical protein